MPLKCYRYVLVVSLAMWVLGLMTPAFGQIVNTKSTVIGTDHDIASLGGGCKSCHTPHQASAKGGTLLWAPAFSTQTFGVYDSPTLDSKATEIGDATYSATNPPTGSKLHSILCMSCHDGVTTPSVIGPTDGHAIGNPTNSAGLTNDHPVNMGYDPGLDTGLTTVAAVTATNVRLWSEDGPPKVQCSSCHDPHNAPGVDHFLRRDNAGSALCTTCHQ